MAFSEHWKALMFVLEEHCDWYHSLVQCLFYPEDLHSVKKPTSFAQWFVHANREEGLQPEIIEKLAALHTDLFKLADVLVHTTKETGKKPPSKDFQNFLTVYEEFFIFIRRLEKDLLVEGSGYDSFTGLRNKKLLFGDIERELHRLERQGKSFCVAMIRIDNFDIIQQCEQRNNDNGYIKLISGLIKLSVRSFDDAYYMGEDEFVLCLKQADVSGGISALERLRKELERQDVTLPLKSGSDVPLSMSCCIAEPLSGDDVHDLIKNLRSDLKSSNHEKVDTVLEYHELSPLQRYIQEDSREH